MCTRLESLDRHRWQSPKIQYPPPDSSEPKAHLNHRCTCRFLRLQRRSSNLRAGSCQLWRRNLLCKCSIESILYTPQEVYQNEYPPRSSIPSLEATPHNLEVFRNTNLWVQSWPAADHSVYPESAEQYHYSPCCTKILFSPGEFTHTSSLFRAFTPLHKIPSNCCTWRLQFSSSMVTYMMSTL